jgi:hypothetical protein
VAYRSDDRHARGVGMCILRTEFILGLRLRTICLVWYAMRVQE